MGRPAEFHRRAACRPLLENAINLERFGGAQSTEVVSYAPNRVTDLPGEREQWNRPVLYHLFGRVSASPTYVISDEDLLEFICALQNEHLAPEKLFHELEHSHLLFIGSNFSNWLARLFLRMAKRQRLTDPRDVGEVVANDSTGLDERLMGFLQQVSVRTRVVTGAERFVDELHARWSARRRPAQSPAATGINRYAPPAREMPDRAVFISYAREDLAAVQQIKAGLEAVGVTTWFDMDRLDGGDDYDRKIRRNIERYSYFIPVVSAATQRRQEAYFRCKWSYALDRTRNMADGAIFLLPVTSNPWLGLASFTEETRAYFFGREEEVAELARRVQRKLLTVLFGQLICPGRRATWPSRSTTTARRRKSASGSIRMAPGRY